LAAIGKGMSKIITIKRSKTSAQPLSPAGEICTSYLCPNEAFPVRWCAFDGDHIPAPRDGANGTGTDTWVPNEVWQFFSQF
jgi:hypothetical protein